MECGAEGRKETGGSEGEWGMKKISRRLGRRKGGEINRAKWEGRRGQNGVVGRVGRAAGRKPGKVGARLSSVGTAIPECTDFFSLGSSPFLLCSPVSSSSFLKIQNQLINIQCIISFRGRI